MSTMTSYETMDLQPLSPTSALRSRRTSRRTAFGRRGCATPLRGSELQATLGCDRNARQPASRLFCSERTFSKIPFRGARPERSSMRQSYVHRQWLSVGERAREPRDGSLSRRSYSVVGGIPLALLCVLLYWDHCDGPSVCRWTSEGGGRYSSKSPDARQSVSTLGHWFVLCAHVLDDDGGYTVVSS